MEVYRYYLTAPVEGSRKYPRHPDKQVYYKRRRLVAYAGMLVYGHADYSKPLPESIIRDLRMVSDSRNPAVERKDVFPHD